MLIPLGIKKTKNTWQWNIIGKKTDYVKIYVVRDKDM